MPRRPTLEQMPFAELLDMELAEVGDGRAVGRMPMTDAPSSREETHIAHGGATYALADTVGGAAVMSVTDSVTPTVDMRIDYLAPVTRDIRAEAEVVRSGEALAVVRVEVYDAADAHVATAHGTYKTDGPDGETAWDGHTRGDGDAGEE